MKITTTLSLYLAKRYVFNLLILLVALLSIIYLFDVVELIRRASKNSEVPMGLIIQMGLLKLPDVGQKLFPFAVLFSAMFTFWQLTRKYELIVVRASGFSVWQFLMPITAVGILFGALQMAVINPVSAIFIGKYEQMERVHLKRKKNEIAVFEAGLWLKQNILIDDIGQNGEKLIQNNAEDFTEGYVILHAQKLQQKNWVLQNVTVMYFQDGNHFLQRVDAQNATLKPGFWQLNNVTIHKNIKNAGMAMPERLKTFTVPTSLTQREIEESFSSPESMSFWKLPAYIKTLEQTGFDATRLKVYYQSLLSQPLMFCAMILLAACVSMRPPRARGTFIMVGTGVMIGFIIFFISSFLQAMGSSQQIPVLMAAWAPALISFLLGLSVMMNIEDG